jgi:hypothetical protein
MRLAAENRTGAATIHVWYDGRSFDIPVRDLNGAAMGSAREMKRALVTYLDLPFDALERYVVEQHETGNWTVRPEAVFG